MRVIPPEEIGPFLRAKIERANRIERTPVRVGFANRQPTGPKHGERATQNHVLHQLDWLVAIEPDPVDVDSVDKYRELMSPYKAGIDRAISILSTYAREHRPATLRALQDEYRAISSKYGYNDLAMATASAYLRTAWNGINGWIN